MKKISHKKQCITTLLLFPAIATMMAQTANSTYFLHGVESRQQLNPAFTPNRGYVKIPFFGGLNIAINSNGLDVQSIRDVIEEERNTSHTDENPLISYYLKDEFIRKLRDNNSINESFNTDLFSFGWFRGKGFWNVNISLKADVGVNVPKNVFSFMRDVRGFNQLDWTNYSITSKNIKLHINSYEEIGIGYTHPIGEKFTLGGKVKMLLGLANANIGINQINIKTNVMGIEPKQNWDRITYEQLQRMRGEASIYTEARGELSVMGLELVKNNDGSIDKICRKGNWGLAGMGVGLDLGAEYKVTKYLTVSASVLDLGFISWKEKVSHLVSSNESKNYRFNARNIEEAEKFREIMTDEAVLNQEMFKIREDKQKARNTSLYTTLLLGAEYTMLKNKLSLGVLYKNRFISPKSTSEIMLSSAYKFTKGLGLSLTYSKVNYGSSSLGTALKLGSFVLASDYLYWGSNTKSLNFTMGLSVPLGSKKP